MTPEEWRKVRPILESALELGSANRSHFLDNACGEPSLRRQVESLIAAHEQAGTNALNAAALPSFTLEEEARFRLLPGKRVGPYEILEEIALGGMGAVYRAVRADGQYKQQVALKIVRADLGAELTAARFRNERQILASLDHTNIAKILDGGTTSDGLPFFVMEFIDGLLVTEYCDQRKLPVEARLDIFRTVCSAVHHAHQRLVIHRDLKPSNILVTAEGVPKLLDFGIAKILDPSLLPENMTMTGAGLWLMTPEYASPEQFRGQPITTATDVYSLGLVLYELLTGRRAYRFPSRMPQDVAQVVLETDPEKPSDASRPDKGDELEKRPRTQEVACTARGDSSEKLRRRLAGDLDNIVMKAIRKEPAERYTSADQLSEDIRRHLEGLPVLARQSTVAYRFRKYVLRHKVGVTAAALVLVSLVTGIALTAREARIARANALRAENRFNDVRQLANSLMFEIHDSIRDLPGATKARELLVRRALEYLDGLSHESDDPALQRELAAAYVRIGDVQGYTGAANLDDFAAALGSYAKALAIRETLAAAHPDDAALRSELVQDYFNVANALQNTGDFEGELGTLQKARPLVSRLSTDPNDQQFRTASMYYYTARALERTGDFPGALANYQQAASTLEPVAEAGNAIARSYIAEHYIGIAKVLTRMGRADNALSSVTQGRAMIQKLLANDPQNATFLGYLGENYDATTDVLMTKGDLIGALQFALQTQAVYKRLLSADPADQMARADIAWSDVSIAEILLRENKPQQAIRHVQDAVANFGESGPSKGYWNSVELGQSYLDLGKAYAALAERTGSAQEKARLWREAKSWDEEALKARTASPGQRDDNGVDQVAEIHRQLARCDAHTRGG